MVLQARRGMGRAPGEVRRVRRIRGPQTVAEVAATGAAGGILLLVALVVLHALARPAPRGSPVVAVDDGTLTRLSRSPAGGMSVYQLDAAERHCFFYAHLERYAAGLAEGQPVKRGDVIAYVGTTGNAPPNTPHLHFAIHEVTSPKQCWGRAVDPYPLWP